VPDDRPTADATVEPRFVELADPDGRTRWVLDAGFLGSGWRCRWGCGCQGIHDEPTPELAEGCCSVGVVLADEEEAMTVAALAATMGPAGFQHAAEAAGGAVVHDGARWSTRVVDGACIFFNRVGFAGGTGCALHLAALAEGGDPIDAKPWTCSKLPLRTEERTLGDGTVEVTVRAWRRDDWGPGGRTMAWWCTEAPECFDDERPVVDRMAPELTRILGEDVYALARAALAPGAARADRGDGAEG
jgi:hypothetical protein